MSIEMENPKTVLELVDAAANNVAQVRLALSIYDYGYASTATERAADLLAKAMEMLNECDPTERPRN